MSTTFIAMQAPIGEVYRLYDRSVSATNQSGPIPPAFRDAMLVRELVFVEELQGVPLVHHMDNVEGHCWHWTLYRNPDTVAEGRKPQLVGTIRLVPFPQWPHPQPGSHFDAPPPTTPILSGETFFATPSPKYAVDRSTTLHDGVEPYVKLGRMAVVKEFRGRKYADQLVQAALKWAAENEKTLQKEGVPEWKGLVGIHASVKAVTMYERNGFVVDKGMGTWYEAGLEHCGIFARVDVKQDFRGSD